jgi:Ca-activated chloride channel family protein
MRARARATILFLLVSSVLFGVVVWPAEKVEPIQTGILELQVHQQIGSTKAPLDGAKVVLRDPKRIVLAQEQTTGGNGIARFLVVPVGSDYVLEVTATGFSPTTRTGVTIRADRTTSIEVELQGGPDELPDAAVLHLDSTVGCDFRVTVDGVSEIDPVTGLRLSRLSAQAINVNSAAGTDAYAHRVDSSFRAPERDPLSTFAIDVDTASYSNVRRYLTSGSLPPADAVRIEELLNYFQFDDPAPAAGEPFAVTTELGACPWRQGNALLRIGLKATPIEYVRAGVGNFVFLVDVSGSMDEPNKLPLVKAALRMLVRQLRGSDRVAIVVYAGTAGLVLDSTSNQREILDAIDRLEAGGSTAGGAGIVVAYRTAAKNFVEGGVNRVILATDGDFNVGVSSEGELVRLIEQQAETGVFLSVLGFGTGNLQDFKLEQLADRGNGQYHYIDSVHEARRVMVEQVGGTLVTVAKDVKVQVEFNPAAVAQYRLIGYENRMLAAEDFLDDTKDAGELGAGHSVTALYEIAPIGLQTTLRPVEPLKYASQRVARSADQSELATVKLRYKAPTAKVSVGREFVVMNRIVPIDSASGEWQFAAAIATFGMTLRHAPDRGSANLELARHLAMRGLATDSNGARHEFIELLRMAKALRR